jgi:hypothetical protein
VSICVHLWLGRAFAVLLFFMDDFVFLVFIMPQAHGQMPSMWKNIREYVLYGCGPTWNPSPRTFDRRNGELNGSLPVLLVLLCF